MGSSPITSAIRNRNSMVECLPFKQYVESSSLSDCTNVSIAQLAESLALNHQAVGSSPTGCTIGVKCLR